MNISIGEHAQRLVIYIGEADRWRGKPLYAALLETLKAQGMAGATVVRGVAGFGAHSRIHTASILRLSEDLPLRIEVIDGREKIEMALQVIAPMVNEGLIVIDDVQVIKYTHRYLNPLPSDRPVAEVMTREVVTLAPDMSLGEAWDRMLQNNLKALPVVDENRVVLGVLTDEDLLQRAGVGVRLGVAERLDKALLQQEFQRLAEAPQRVEDVMSKPPLTVHPQEPLAIAAARMANAKIKRLPVVDEAGKLVGVIARIDVLRQVANAQTKSRQKEPLVHAGKTVADVMSREIPVVRADATLVELADAFVAGNTHRMIVVGPMQQPLGLVSDADVVTRVQSAQQGEMLDALRQRGPVPESRVTARDLMSPELLTVAPETPLTEAIQLMLSHGRKWMIVADAQGGPVGLVDRQALLKAVAGS